MKLPKISIVIGANYGDEGKGLVTNALTTGKDTVVVLTNGGAQRGHTVVQDGIRHVFHHFGSGHLKGATTYCAESFIINPIIFLEEVQALKLERMQKRRAELFSKEKGLFIYPLISDRCRVTTIYDMLANRIRCILSGKNDSTGYGIWETIQRYEADSTFYRFGDFYRTGDYLNELKKIRDYYINKFKDLNTPDASSELKECLNLLVNDNLKFNFINDFRSFNKFVLYCPDYTIITKYKNIIFEQGQGLAINRTDKEFGTPSDTDSTLPIQVLQKAFGDKFSKLKIDRYYITRSYLTRHGDGPFTEDKEFAKKFNDKTNVHNEFQGSIKYAPMDRGSFLSMLTRIFKDYYKNSVKVFGDNEDHGEINLVVTHLNEEALPYLNETNNENKLGNENINLKFSKIFGSYDESTINVLYNKIDAKSAER